MHSELTSALQALGQQAGELGDSIDATAEALALLAARGLAGHGTEERPCE